METQLVTSIAEDTVQVSSNESSAILAITVTGCGIDVECTEAHSALKESSTVSLSEVCMQQD